MAWFGDNLAVQKKRFFCTSKIEQGKSVDLPDSDFSDVVRVVDVKGWACDLFVLGPGHQQHPEEASSCGEERSGVKVGTFSLT